MEDKTRKLLELLADTLHEIYKHLDYQSQNARRQDSILENLNKIREEIRNLNTGSD